MYKRKHLDYIVIGTYISKSDFLMSEKYKSILPQGYNFLCNFNQCLNNLASSFINIGIEPIEGAFPSFSKKIILRKRLDFTNKIFTCSYFNFFGIRNLSIFFHLKLLFNRLERKYFEIDSNTIVIVSEAFTPYLLLSKYIKNRFNIKVISIVQDLPEFMSQIKRSFFYNFLKKVDNKIFYRTLKKVDGFIFLTKYMNKRLNIYNAPFIVIEGIVSDSIISEHYQNYSGKIKSIFYGGSLHKKFGVLNLIEACALLKRNDFCLNIYGKGDCLDEIKKLENKYHFLNYKGVLKNEDIINIERSSFLLINPRLPEGEYTKFSFPSKNLEYLCSSRPTIAYMLDGIPKTYENLLFVPKSSSIAALSDKINEVLDINDEFFKQKFKSHLLFLKNRNVTNTTNTLLNFFEEVKHKNG